MFDSVRRLVSDDQRSEPYAVSGAPEFECDWWNPGSPFVLANLTTLFFANVLWNSVKNYQRSSIIG